MTRMMASGLALSLGLLVSSSSAQEIQWRPAAPRPMAASSAATPAPGVSLGRPIALDSAGTAGAPPARIRDAAITPASYSAATLAAPQPIVRGQSVDARPLPPGTPGVTDPVAAYVVGASPVTTYAPTTVLPAAPAEGYNSGVVTEPPPPPCGHGLFCCGPVCGETGCASRTLFESDHCFDEFISPISNPFLFLDPRALTQVRPIFMYQSTPHSNPVLHGGSAEFFGVQASLAITPQWSVIVNRLGGVALQPGADGADQGGFSELWLTPQWTFLRIDSSKTLAAAGVTFQIPAGSGAVFQDTGTLSVVPYLSFAQSFGRTSWGTFNYMGTTGFSVATDNKRSEYFFLSTHLDYDVANLHKIYPLIELNWFNYTRSGNSAPNNINFEGRDLIDFGGNGVAGGNSVTMALGCRYKFNEHFQTGIAAEFPLVRQRDITDFRLTLDLIIRY